MVRGPPVTIYADLKPYPVPMPASQDPRMPCRSRVAFGVRLTLGPCMCVLVFECWLLFTSRNLILYHGNDDDRVVHPLKA